MKLIRHIHVPFVSSIALVTALAACGGGGETTTEGAGASGASTSNPNGGAGGEGEGGAGGLFNNTGGIGGDGGSKTTTSGNTTTTTAPPDPNGLCLSPTATDGATQWALKAGADNVQSALGITADAQGNVVVAGAFQGTIDLGAGVLTSAGLNDAYVAKLGANGTAMWSKKFGDGGFHQYAQHVATDAQRQRPRDRLLPRHINFGGQNLSDISNFFDDIFVAKLDAAGNHVWSKRYGDINSEESKAIATDAQSNVLVAGAFQKTVNFGGGAIVAEDGGFNAFVAKLTPAGEQVWAKSFGDTAAEQKALGVTADDDGNVYVVGYHKGSIDFGGGALAAEGTDQNAYVAKLNPQGTFVWAKTFGTDTASAVDVGVDTAGNVLVLGNFKGKINFGGDDLDAGVANNVFLLKLDAAGALVWAKNYGTPNKAEEATSIALDGDKPIVLGIFTDKIDFGGGALTSAGGFDVFLAKLDADGCQSHAKSYGADMLQRGETLAVDATGNILFAGSFDGTVDFGAGALTATATDAYFVKTKP
jgi:hypothetical protein